MIQREPSEVAVAVVEKAITEALADQYAHLTEETIQRAFGYLNKTWHMGRCRAGEDYIEPTACTCGRDDVTIILNAVFSRVTDSRLIGGLRPTHP